MLNYEITSNPKVYFYYYFHKLVEGTFQIEGDEKEILQFIDGIILKISTRKYHCMICFYEIEFYHDI